MLTRLLPIVWTFYLDFVFSIRVSNR